MNENAFRKMQLKTMLGLKRIVLCCRKKKFVSLLLPLNFLTEIKVSFTFIRFVDLDVTKYTDSKLLKNQLTFSSTFSFRFSSFESEAFTRLLEGNENTSSICDFLKTKKCEKAND